MTRASALLLTFMLTAAATAFGQPATPSVNSKAAVTAVMVEVTIARYQGEKRLSSLPYTIGVTPDGSRQTLRVGGSVAIPSTTAPSADGKGSALSSYSYRDIGTNIDVTAAPAEDGRYRIGLIIEESSVYPSDETVKSQVLVSGVPAFRSLRSNNAVTLRHGQSIEYSVATDRITGETARISVKLTVVN